MIKLKAFVKGDRSRVKEPDAKWLELEQYVVKGVGYGFFVLYYNDNGESYADTHANTLKAAIETAYFDCNLKPEDWQIVKSED